MTQKLYKVTLPEMWVGAHGPTMDEARLEAKSYFREIVSDLRTRDLEIEEIGPDHPDFEEVYDDWGYDDLDVLDPIYAAAFKEE